MSDIDYTELKGIPNINPIVQESVPEKNHPYGWDILFMAKLCMDRMYFQIPKEFGVDPEHKKAIEHFFRNDEFKWIPDSEDCPDQLLDDKRLTRFSYKQLISTSFDDVMTKWFLHYKPTSEYEGIIYSKKVLDKLQEHTQKIINCMIQAYKEPSQPLADLLKQFEQS
jgi:inorganic pyrophosphatase